MKAEILFENVRVFDGRDFLSQPQNVAVKDGKVFFPDPVETVDATIVVPGTGLILSPGFLDSHMHIFEGSGGGAAWANSYLFSNGAVAGFDMGSSGVISYPLYHQTVVENSIACIKAGLNIAPEGMEITRYHPENVDPAYYREADWRLLMDRYPGEIIAVKLRLNRETMAGHGTAPLFRAAEFAKQLSLPLLVHYTASELPAGTVLDALSPGDIFVHVYNGKGQTVLDENGRLQNCLWKARERGVLFDAAHGVGNFSIAVARQAVAEGFFPDIISSDVGRNTLYRGGAEALPNLMSRLLNLGMPLQDVLRAVTSTPARAYGVGAEFGNLKNGAPAHLTLFRLDENAQLRFVDYEGEVFYGNLCIQPVATVCRGELVYKSPALNLKNK